MYFYIMEKPENIKITHEALGGYDDDSLSSYLIVIESVNDKIIRTYAIKRPLWHRYYDKTYPYNPPNLN